MRSMYVFEIDGIMEPRPNHLLSAQDPTKNKFQTSPGLQGRLKVATILNVRQHSTSPIKHRQHYSDISDSLRAAMRETSGQRNLT